MQIDETMDGDVLILSIQGRLDSNTSKQLDEVLTNQVQNRPAVVLDFSGLEYISSAGLRVLLKGAKQARASNGKLALCSLSPHVREVFDISGFSNIFSIQADRQTALAAVK
ncbi:STAS domain-containing protein [Aquibaculum arenosum]|uniref:Anti-sigma factor antagonist n=1 Tax=Aquibaculum arenosum TaxID=3032591 RepID=A0ABT5YKN5_9PROT|nr:STAS domain-containing protein [Fodinicurvata sp. CAU 1616]MDF2095506.1 STAS domain-containing protein [Fodinicurvata sp. CAU 1616]